MIAYFGPSDIHPHLSISALRDAARAAFIAISDGSAQAPVYVLHPNDQADIHVKSAVLPDCPIFTVKMAGWSQVLADRGEPPTSGLICVFDSTTCKPLAILEDDHLISDYRTAAAGALVAELLAPKDATHALILGTGVQARLQCEALLMATKIREVALWGRSPDKAAALCQALRTAHPDATFRTSTDLEQDARAADVIVTATAARAPLIQSDWIRPGQHITSVGSDDATKCELDPALLARAALFVDAAASGRAYGSPHRAIEAGLISPEAMTEIGALVMTPRPRAADALTVACLSGLGIQDLLAVRALWDRITT